MHCPDQLVTLLFLSHPTRDVKLRWRVKLTFPAGADDNTLLPIEVVDGEDVPIDNAIFEFAGQKLKVERGRASILAADFIRGKSETALWLYRPGKSPIPGGLTFA